MGWSSAVAVMQEISERLTVIGRLPASHRVRRTAPLPPWLTSVVDQAVGSDKAWYHVYLDNFCAMSKVQPGELATMGRDFHQRLEQAWASVGVLSSDKKKVADEPKAQELGAFFDGEAGTMGPSRERLLRLIQTTLVVISKRRLRIKWVQVIAGRWVHCMAFRRPCMAFLDVTWAFVSKQVGGESAEAKVRSELLNCAVGCLLMHTHLRADISSTTTASDASSTGGAVGKSTELTPAGEEFASADRNGLAEAIRAPVLVLSLFNGVGCCFRCYDLAGVTPMVAISYELTAAANRVTSRRWPHVRIEKDVRSIDRATIEQWRYLYPGIEEIHVWGGWPCVDLSKVKFGRLNLEGEQSGLFWEMVRIIKLIRQVYGFSFPLLFAAENVASMDESAEAEVTATLGVKPWRLDSSDSVPIHRPRFCWTNAGFHEMAGVEIVEKPRWFEVSLLHEYPLLEQWLGDNAEWPGFWEGAILPTCMKSIRRIRPPPKPAGLNRVSREGKLRWEADEFRFPPYQYDERFLIWVGEKWRLITAEERELLHGLGFGHTEVCLNAGEIKRDPQNYEDLRKTLIGDSFNCFSFCYVAAMLCHKLVSVSSYHQLWNRTGMAPGFACPIHVMVPLQRRLSYGNPSGVNGVDSLHRALLRRVNHTGSDVRVTTGALVNPKAYPRQSSCAAWWKWSKVFAYRWSRPDHINSLEFRSVIHSMEWRIRHLREVNIRVVHLSDSYVAMSIISKGRSSSRMLKPLVSQLAALLLACGIYLVVSHVESTENPTDHDSRS